MSNMKYKVGDRVRVVGNDSGHCFQIGAVVVIIQMRARHNDYKCRKENAMVSWYCQETDLAPILKKQNHE